MDKRIIHEIGKKYKVTPSTMDKLDRLGLLKRNGIIREWNNILYERGITKRHISSYYKYRPIPKFYRYYFLNVTCFAKLDGWVIPKLIEKGIVTRFPPSKRKRRGLSRWARRIYFYSDNMTSAYRKKLRERPWDYLPYEY